MGTPMAFSGSLVQACAVSRSLFPSSPFEGLHGDRSVHPAPPGLGTRGFTPSGSNAVKIKLFEDIGVENITKLGI